MLRELTDAEFGVFKTEVLRWVEVFGLNDWEVRVERRPTSQMADLNYMAQCHADLEGMGATISLGAVLPDEYADEREIRNSALHEVLELLLIELDPDKRHERHQAINRLIKVLEAKES